MIANPKGSSMAKTKKFCDYCFSQKKIGRWKIKIPSNGGEKERFLCERHKRAVESTFSSYVSVTRC
jgi:hypothetical protein